jgi:hypothetical protein
MTPVGEDSIAWLGCIDQSSDLGALKAEIQAFSSLIPTLSAGKSLCLGQ